MKSFYVYMLASRYKGTLYVGMTSNLIARIHQHKEHQIEGFAREHRVHRLVWYEEHYSSTSAIKREKRLKRWNRAWKIRLIEESNPRWDDLYRGLFVMR